VAGLGRGAQGFTTQSDIGPSRQRVPTGADGPLVADFGQAPKGYVGGMGRGSNDAGLAVPRKGFGSAKDNVGERKDDFSQFDKFGGFTQNLFDGVPYTADDKEADSVWAAVDDRMDSRRKRQREEDQSESLAKYRKEHVRIADQFKDLKTELATVSQAEWEGIPEVGDHTAAAAASKLRQKSSQQYERYTPVPDSVLASGMRAAPAASIASRQQLYAGGATPLVGGGGKRGGLNTPFAGIGSASVSGATSAASVTNSLSSARGQVLSLRLDKMSDSVTGQTVVDPKGYLTDLNSLKMTSDAEIGDIKRAEMLLTSVTRTNPKHGPGWVAAARLAEYSGKMSNARSIIKQGCTVCPTSEDVWLEAVRLQTSSNAKSVLADAVRHLPHSVKVWMVAVELEGTKETKRVVLRRALEHIPNSVRLWKVAVALENEEDAKIMLSRAVECVPQSVDLWLALARLETYANAQAVLNRARNAVPTDVSIWISAAQLEEANLHVSGRDSEMVAKIVNKAIRSLQKRQVKMDRDQWLSQAESAEEAGAPLTAAAIITATIDVDVEAQDRRSRWQDDAERALGKGAVHVARSIWAHALSVFPTKIDIWLKAVDLERNAGTNEALEALLRRGVAQIPDAEILWLMAAKHKWRTCDDIESARKILKEGFTQNSDSEALFLAAVKLEWENGEWERARRLLTRARQESESQRVWMKSALLEWQRGNLALERKLLDVEDGGGALARYPNFDKLWLMAGQMEEEEGNAAAARERYGRGLARCHHSIPLWLAASRLEERTSSETKARSLLELGRLKNKKNDELWLESVRLERRAGSAQLAATLMATALQECPSSGILWAEDIAMHPKVKQRTRAADALRACDDDAIVVLAVARLFWRSGKTSKARKWLERSAVLRPDLGDAWAYYYRFELDQHAKAVAKAGGGADAARSAGDGGKRAKAVLRRGAAHEPNRGEHWLAFAKRREQRKMNAGEILPLIVEGGLVP
tara:strand:- start:760 stop:3714 length:2955 start_codon:yes stop_codon:yes gene_type:complete